MSDNFAAPNFPIIMASLQQDKVERLNGALSDEDFGCLAEEYQLVVQKFSQNNDYSIA